MFKETCTVKHFVDVRDVSHFLYLDPPNFPITLQLPKNKNNICQKLYTGFTSRLIYSLHLSSLPTY